MIKKNDKIFSRNFTLVLGLGILCSSLVWFAFYLVVDFNHAQALSFRPSQPPSMDHWLGTDRMGKDVLTSIVIGTPQTIQIGVVAGGIGIVLGVILGFMAGFLEGLLTTLSNSLTFFKYSTTSCPHNIRDFNSWRYDNLTVVIDSWGYFLAWANRVLRSQVLVMKELNYVSLSRFSGLPSWKIIFMEILPNLLP